MELSEPQVASQLWCVTFPWEVPPNTIIVERSKGRWRVVSRGRPVAVFRQRHDALAYAQRIAAVFLTPHRIVEVDEDSQAGALAS